MHVFNLQCAKNKTIKLRTEYIIVFICIQQNKEVVIILYSDDTTQISRVILVLYLIATVHFRRRQHYTI